MKDYKIKHKSNGCRFEAAQVHSWIFFFHLLFKHTIFPRKKAQAFNSFPAFQTQPLNEGGLYSRPGVYFQ